jgi:hypothetical protein
MGQTLPWTKYPELSLKVPNKTDAYAVAAPPAISIKAYRNGEEFPLDIVAAGYAKQAFEPGTYRIEVYRDDLGSPFDQMPWIISNPIYVR